MAAEVSRMLDELQERVSGGVDDLRRYLASPEGRQLRQRVAQVLIFTAPFVFRFGPFKASRVGRLVALLGGTAVVVKLAEALRDWEPAREPAGGAPS
ncbi:MAG TPA: hypothetical protein VHL78_05495 [Actinomycetota bacterium]|nr:hypothetical protein [Actinomycetota bacterium]